MFEDTNEMKSSIKAPRRKLILILRYIFCFCIITGILFQTGCSLPPASSVQQYIVKRGELLKNIRHHVRSENIALSEDELAVNTLLERMKADARSKQLPGKPWAAQYFPLVKHNYEQTELYAFFKAMPKGAILHIHPIAMGDYRRLIHKITRRPDTYVNRGKEHYGSLAVFAENPGKPWSKIMEERATLPQGVDKNSYDDNLLSLITLDASDKKLPDIWEEFGKVFSRVYGLFTDENLWEDYLYNSLKSYVENDNVQHMELRSHKPNQNTFRMYRRILKRLENHGTDISLRIIYCDSRARYPGESYDQFQKRILDSLHTAADLMEANHDLLVGVDIYAEEDKGAPASFMAPLMIEAQNYSRKKYGRDLPLYLHDGESNLAVRRYQDEKAFSQPFPKPYNNNVIDAYLLDSQRVGHGISLWKIPKLSIKYRDKGIALEICPVSNQILGFVPDLRNHPAVSLMNNGVRISLNPDDPAVFGYEGVTFDYVVACLAWDLSLADLKSLALDSLEDSALGEKEKRKSIEKWKDSWRVFIARFK